MSPVADFLIGVLVVCLLASGRCADLPTGTFGVDCLDRYFRLGFDTTFTGEDVRFEAVDDTGVHPITEQYAAECGYSVNVRPHLGFAELRASYFSCTALNEDDETFTFSFNMIVTQDGVEETYDVNKTCTLALPWSSRELNCEVNYMELTMRKDVHFPGTKGAHWTSAVDNVYGLAHDDWQVLFQKGDQQFSPITLSTAEENGYTISMTRGRYVFRMPYGQPDSTVTLVDGVTVDTVHATLFTRKGWTVLVVDLLAACPMSDGFYNDSSLVWLNPLETGETDQQSQRLRIGANGQLLEPVEAAARGYNMEVFGSQVQVTIPFDAVGGYKKSFVQHNIYSEYYLFNMYFENQFIDVNQMDTRLRQYRPLVSPLLSWPKICINQTVLSEHTFTVYIGVFAEDVQLTALMLTGREYIGDVMNANISEVFHPNFTHGYTLGMRFNHPIVPMELSEEGILQYTLDMNFTLSIMPAMVESFYHHATVVAVFKDVFPPIFEAHCYEKGISFKLDLGPFAYLWAVYAGPYPLTEVFAMEQGYHLINTSEGQILNVPLFSTGYIYKNIGMKTFEATFEILVRGLKSLKVKGTTVKTCQFATTELIVCSPKGHVTIVANMSAIPSAGDPYRISLLNRTCGAKESDKSSALFTFGVQTCGTKVKLTNDFVVYENEVVFEPKILTEKGPPRLAMEAPERITVQCAYHLSGLYRLFQLHKFVSDYAGVGSIRHDPHFVQQKMAFDGNDPAAAPLLNVSIAEEIMADKPTKYSKVVYFLKDLVTARFHP
ncbi:unnamed protein product [Gadus morhua 'NCC']